MSEVKKLTIVGIVLAILFSFSILIYALDKKDDVKTNTSSKTNTSTKATTSEYMVYYLGREGCGYCKIFTPNIESMKENYGVEYTYIDIEAITSEELSDYLDKFHITGSFGTPTIAIMKGDEYIANSVGYLTEQELFNFLKANGVVTGKFISAEYPNITYIDFDDYKKIVESNDKRLVILAQDGCTGCDDAQKYLNSLAKSNKLEVNWYNVSFETEDDYNYFYNSYEFIKKGLDDDELYTPTFMVVENKKVIASLSKYTSEEDLNKLLKNNGLIK